MTNRKILNDTVRKENSVVCSNIIIVHIIIITNECFVLTFLSGKYSCSLILMNEDIGEFLYTVEAKAVYPQVSALPFKPGPHSVRISSAAAASKCNKR